MSLEKTLERIANALEKRNELLEATSQTVVTGVYGGTDEEKPKAKKKVKAKKEEEPEVDTDEEVEEKPKKKEKAKTKKEEPKAEDIHKKKFYTETVQPKTREAAGALGKEIVLGILDEFGTNLETARDLEEDQWEDYVARLDEEMAAAEDTEEDEDDLS